MNPIVGWVIGILSIVLLGTVIDLLLSENKMGKYIKAIFAAVTILVIIMPIPSLLRNGVDWDNGFIIQNEFELDENFLAFADRIRISALERGLEAQLASEGIRGTQVRIEGRVINSEIYPERVQINLANVVIDSNLAHINRYEHVAVRVSYHLSIDRGRIFVHGA